MQFTAQLRRCLTWESQYYDKVIDEVLIREIYYDDPVFIKEFTTKRMCSIVGYTLYNLGANLVLPGYGSICKPRIPSIQEFI